MWGKHHRVSYVSQMVGKVDNVLETVAGNDSQFVQHSTLYSVDMIPYLAKPHKRAGYLPLGLILSKSFVINSLSAMSRSERL